MRTVLFACLAIFSCASFAAHHHHGHHHGHHHHHGYWGNGVYINDYDDGYYLDSGYGPGWYDYDGGYRSWHHGHRHHHGHGHHHHHHH